MSSHDKLRQALTDHGYKITSARKRVYTVLANATQPLTSAEMINMAKDIDKVSVYRTIELFDSLGITHRTWNGFKSKIELSDPFSPHHHHFTCRKCASVISFKSKAIEETLTAIEKTMNLSIHSHLVELTGICGNCKKGN